jgi:ribosome biogenesis protein BMS1
MSEGHDKQVNRPHHRKKTKGNQSNKRSTSTNDKFIDLEKKNKTSLDDNNENDKTSRTGRHETDDQKAARQRNPKAFALQSFVAAERKFRRTQDINAKRLAVPEVDRASLEPPPIVVALVGPPKVGKSILMQNLIKNYTRQRLNNIKGPVTVVTSKSRRITFIECNNDLNSIIDVAKVADLVLLLIDASFGFEMETFEFLNVCQVHGFPRIMGVLTHMDMVKTNKQLKKTKKRLKHRFWTEIYQVTFEFEI